MKPTIPFSSLLRSLRGSALLLFLAVSGPAFGAEIPGPAVGFLRFACPGNADTVVSAPFQKNPRWSGRPSGTPTSPAGGVVRVMLALTPDFAAGELTGSPHFLLCRTSPGPVGRAFPIVAHSGNGVDLATTPDSLAGLGTESLVTIVPAWTLETLFPSATQTTFHLSTGPLATQRGSELIFFDNTTAGIDLAPSRRFYVTSAGWFETGSYTPADGVVLTPGEAFVVRHAPGATDTTFTPASRIDGGPVAFSLPVSDTLARDTVVAPPRPVALTLDELDLTAGVFIESHSTAPADRRDLLMIFDNTGPGPNKLPAATYFRTGGQWVQELSGFPPAGSTLIEPGQGILIRKATGPDSTILQWNNLPVYDLQTP